MNNAELMQAASVIKSISDPINVTQPSLPPLDEFVPYLKKIWDSKLLTNGGPFHQQLEKELCEYLGVAHISLFTNATVGLVTALQALQVSGEVITTPYSFVATAHSMAWNGIKPVFVDIDPHTFNLDPSKIEEAITPRTTAIMPVHCYGHPCDVEAIQRIADNYNLKIIYDAAHAFGVQDPGGSILRHGDLSVVSFHATKVFNTFEGGAVICPDQKTKLHIDHLKNFGFVDEVTVVAAGINGKMSEINAAFGVLQLQHIDAAIENRRMIDAFYRRVLQDIPGISFPPAWKEGKANFSYFPIILGDNYPLSRDELYLKLKNKNIYARRYFYPLISEFPMYKEYASAGERKLENAKNISSRVICLPMHPGLYADQVAYVAEVIKEVFQ